MIRFLSIRDLAVVDRLEVEFSDGFNVLTGETGAGKSIIVGALGLLVGGRATNDLVRTGCPKAVVEGTFENVTGEECIVRREISTNGRSRIFIDDGLATVGKLRQLGKSLVDIHGQHEHQALLGPQNHVRYLDSYAGHVELVACVLSGYREWRKLESDLRDEIERRNSTSENLDFLNFQLNEIEAIAPAEGEDDRLLAERARLANAERLVLLASQAYEDLYESDSSVMSSLGAIWKNLEELEAIDESFVGGAENRETILNALSEISEGLRSYPMQIETSPERLAVVEERLAALETIKRKYGGSVKQVEEFRNGLVRQIDGIAGSENKTKQLRERVETARKAFVAESEKLSRCRVEAAGKLKVEFENEIAALAIANCVFEVRIEALPFEEEWRETGLDNVEFFFSANEGETPKPLARTASGGELSRVMLALKTLGRTDLARKTLVFDEVDAGVGGEAAERIGRRLASLGEDFQVLSVTHSPQVAVHGEHHFSVRKTVRAGRSVTSIERLSADEERAVELSRLMTGGVEAIGVDTAIALLEAKRKAKAKGESSRND